MGALNGRMSPLGFRVKGEVTNWEAVLDELTRRRFQAFEPGSGREQSFGWVLLTDPFETEFAKTSIFFGEHLIGLTLRVDSVSVPASQVKLHLTRQVKLKEIERGGEKLTKREIEQMKEDLHAQWLSRTIPTIKLYDMVFHTGSGRLWFFGKSKGAVETFLDLFYETFGVNVVPDAPFTEAAHRIGEEKAEDLLNLEEARFVTEFDD